MIFRGLKGKLTEQEPMNRHVWFRAGGVAQYFFTPEDSDDLTNFLKQKPKEMPYFVIGIGSNLLVRDGGIDGVVIKLGKGFASLSYDETNGMISAGAAVMDANLAKFAGEYSRTGLEFYAGIPGTVGGAVFMNAGAYESDTATCLYEAEIIDGAGNRSWLGVDALNYAYRESHLPAGAIILQARFKTEAGDKQKILRAMTEIQKRRNQTQPIGARTGGSSFKNPDGHKSWQLIDAAGLRGAQIGDAMMSEKHCNFMINRGNASGADLEKLGEQVRAKVYENANIMLEWEIRRIGKPQ